MSDKKNTLEEDNIKSANSVPPLRLQGHNPAFFDNMKSPMFETPSTEWMIERFNEVHEKLQLGSKYGSITLSGGDCDLIITFMVGGMLALGFEKAGMDIADLMKEIEDEENE